MEFDVDPLLIHIDRALSSRGVRTRRAGLGFEATAMILVKLLCLFTALLVCPATPLDDYVYRDDGMFKYAEIREPFWGESATIYFVNMTSQRWLSRTSIQVLKPSSAILHSFFLVLCAANESSRSVWWHHVIVTVPHEIRHPEHAYIYITGGSNHDRCIII